MINRALGIKSITLKKIIENKDKRPKRICFGSKHRDACKRIEIKGNKVVGTINLPFEESIKLFLENETGLKLIQRKDGKFWCPANSEAEYKKLELFFEKYKQKVFLRDTLECSVSLSEHMVDEENRTEIGELEYEAKYNESDDATNKIASIFVDFINNADIFKEASIICAVPSSNKEKLNLPQKIANIILPCLDDKVNISEYVDWKNEKPKIKELDLDEKLKALENVDLNINFDIKNKNVILIDDLYQSGYTMQYIAMKLKESGAGKIFGISIVKSRRDSDNT